MYVDNLYENKSLDSIEPPKNDPLTACILQGCFMNICAIN